MSIYGFGKPGPEGAARGKRRKRAGAGADAQVDKAKRQKSALSRRLIASALSKFNVEGDSRARTEAFLHLGLIPADIAKAISEGKARLVDHTYMSTKPAAKVTKFFESGDEKTPGVSNLKGNTLPKGYGFLVSAIRVTTGKAADGTAAGALRTKYESELAEIPSGSTGFTRFEAQNRAILQEISTDIFNNYGRTDIPKGYHRLDNPRFIGDNGEINFELQFGDITGADANARIKVELIGTMIVPQ